MQQRIDAAAILMCSSRGQDTREHSVLRHHKAGFIDLKMLPPPLESASSQWGCLAARSQPAGKRCSTQPQLIEGNSSGYGPSSRPGCWINTAALPKGSLEAQKREPNEASLAQSHMFLQQQNSILASRLPCWIRSASIQPPDEESHPAC